jgi:hypothetical protein
MERETRGLDGEGAGPWTEHIGKARAVYRQVDYGVTWMVFPTDGRRFADNYGTALTLAEARKAAREAT